MLKSTICLLLMFVTFAFALDAEKDTTTTGFLNKMQIGFLIGNNNASLRYSNLDHKKYNQRPLNRLIFGINGQYRMNNNISFNPSIQFIGKGVSISEQFNYTLDANYMDLNLPFNYHITPAARFADLIFSFGPTFGLATGGKITYDDLSTKVSKANIKPFHFGLRLAVGVQKKISMPILQTGTVILQLAWHNGLTNTYATMEKNGEAVGLNIPNYYIQGTRKHHGYEIVLGFMTPLSLLKKKSKDRIKPSVEIEEKPAPIPEKDCYSIEEITNFFEQGLDIRSRKICLFDIKFEFDKSDVLPESMAIIDEIADLLNSIKSITIKINGHTDSRGGEAYNQKLSTKRALSVYTYLVEQRNIDAARLAYEGFGEKKPIDANDTDEGRARNRRVEFEIVSQ